MVGGVPHPRPRPAPLSQPDDARRACRVVLAEAVAEVATTPAGPAAAAAYLAAGLADPIGAVGQGSEDSDVGEDAASGGDNATDGKRHVAEVRACTARADRAKRRSAERLAEEAKKLHELVKAH